MRRRRRASRMSAPSFRSARLTGSGSGETVRGMGAMYNIVYVAARCVNEIMHCSPTAGPSRQPVEGSEAWVPRQPDMLCAPHRERGGAACGIRVGGDMSPVAAGRGQRARQRPGDAHPLLRWPVVVGAVGGQSPRSLVPPGGSSCGLRAERGILRSAPIECGIDSAHRPRHPPAGRCSPQDAHESPAARDARARRRPTRYRVGRRPAADASGSVVGLVPDERQRDVRDAFPDVRALRLALLEEAFDGLRRALIDEP